MVALLLRPYESTKGLAPWPAARVDGRIRHQTQAGAMASEAPASTSGVVTCERGTRWPNRFRGTTWVDGIFEGAKAFQEGAPNLGSSFLTRTHLKQSKLVKHLRSSTFKPETHPQGLPSVELGLRIQASPKTSGTQYRTGRIRSQNQKASEIGSALFPF